ncbi:unannotated protein [freshwater metagenome]|uniref:Unannotated protein n=1 Tax=freshwater metagenome TaxID=449393 RepID=A0A6J7IZI3_9ZZZZ
MSNQQKDLSVSNLINNYRMGGYLLIAVGLINLRYQTGHNGVLLHSLIIIIPGVLLLASTWRSSAMRFLQMRAGKTLAIVIGLALIAYSIIN